uniref:Trichohyalin-like n=1 Tax=Heterorhabditis bacteriophora TaxID=37862 RepID=A0A1I7X8Z7_HETBA
MKLLLFTLGLFALSALGTAEEAKKLTENGKAVLSKVRALKNEEKTLLSTITDEEQKDLVEEALDKEEEESDSKALDALEKEEKEDKGDKEGEVKEETKPTRVKRAPRRGHPVRYMRLLLLTLGLFVIYTFAQEAHKHATEVLAKVRALKAEEKTELEKIKDEEEKDVVEAQLLEEEAAALKLSNRPKRAAVIFTNGSPRRGLKRAKTRRLKKIRRIRQNRRLRKTRRNHRLRHRRNQKRANRRKFVLRRRINRSFRRRG